MSSQKGQPHSAIPNIPGYRIEGVLGHGGMGSVYLARQLSLDRGVALKVMSQSWASDPVFVARFVREAYAAALLNHPNVVQIFDIGEIENTRYFSMEHVVGHSLADVILREKRLDPEVAVGYILQAARGLKHAHDRGIIHRDIKPDNLLLDEHGVIKVADLGLVKTPDLRPLDDSLSGEICSSESGLHTIPPDMTGVRMALGTPAYMAPEQCRDASAVDHRADIYSLGCTLYALVTGQQPFEARSAMSLMKKHAYTKVQPPEELVPRLPLELSAIILRMMAKNPDERYLQMGDVIRILEQWLGIKTTTQFTPTEQDIAEVERLADAYANSPLAILSQRAVSGFFWSCLLLSVVFVFFGRIGWSFGLAGLLVQASVAYFIINGITRKPYLYRRVVQLMSGMSIGDWIVSLGAVGLFLAFLWMANLFWIWLGCSTLGVATALAFWLILDRQLVEERCGILQDTDLLVRRLRNRSVKRNDVHLFFAKYCGRRWEEFFEAVFGFEAKMNTRTNLLRGDYAGHRERYASWREPILALLDHVERERCKEQDRLFIESAEFQRFLANGMPRKQARRLAEETAFKVVEQAGRIRQMQAYQNPGNGQQDSSLARQWQSLLPKSDRANSTNTKVMPEDVFGLGGILELAFGTFSRGILASVLVALSILWVLQNGLLDSISMSEHKNTSPLLIYGIPTEWTTWCDTANVGWGGILLLTSLFYRGVRMSLMTFLGVAIVILGAKLGIRTVEPIQDTHVSMLLGSTIAMLGFRLGHR